MDDINLGMSSRKRRGGRTGGQPTTKRRRTTQIGQPTPDDDIPTPQAQANVPTASALSVRAVPSEHLPSLAALCMRTLAENLQRLSRDEATWEDVKWWLKQLPDALTQRVFAALRSTCPNLLSHGFITTVRFPEVSLRIAD